MIKSAVLIFCILSVAHAAEWCLKPDPISASVAETPAEKLAPDTPKCSLESPELVMGRLVNGTADRDADLLPSWVDLKLAARGQKWALDNIPLISGSHIFGLMFVLAFPDNNAVLLFTNQSDTANLAMKRYASTIEQVNTWYNGSLKESTDDNDILSSLLRVRGLHTAAMKAGNERMHGENPRPLINKELYERVQLDEGMWKAFETDLKNSDVTEKFRKVPEKYTGRDGKYYAVSQFQQAMTQFAFVGFPVLFPERLFLLDAKDEDLVAYNHLWAVLGHALGIEDEYNIALQPDLKTTKEYYQHIYENWYLPQFFNLDFHTKVLMEAQLQGFEKIDDILTPRTLLLRILRDIVKIPVPNMTRELTPKDHHKMLQFHAKGNLFYK
ncbi:hypothetical protein Fcan01_18576 [Folsomia candida]|uniref:Uncharacterized protein n=1 Tax=Folsomia candida TaxID=158441 RepID=A0A226DLC0_FOLCA|nr:hypothetical protein Fcan01_18576 [Folsomia candida]